MRVFIILAVFISSFTPLGVSALTTKCESALQSLFSESISKDKASEFLQLQSSLTLHRLAWTYLKAQKNDESNKLESVERTIIELLNDKYTNSDPDFIKARRAFESQPLSRATLAEIAPYLKEVLSEKFPEEDEKFKLNSSDLKVLSAIAKFERASAVNGKFDHRMLSSESPQGMLNFIKLINSSYKVKQTEEEKGLSIEMKLNGLEKVLENMERRLSSFLRTISVPPDCQTHCPHCSNKVKMDKFFSNDVQDIFWKSLSDKLESDDVLLQKLTYGKLWLRIKELPPAKRPSIPDVVEEVGVIVEDPLTIIMKDRPGRNREGWKNFEKAFQEAMASAILEDNKVFRYKGKLYDRKTGRVISIENALKTFPPQERERLRGVVESNYPDLRVSLTEAIVNKDQAFIFKDKLYGLQGNELDPATEIAKVMENKLGLEVKPSRYEGMETDYLTARAHALKNNMPYFEADNRFFDSLSGRHLSSPFRNLASTDTRIDKNRRKIYEGLPDEDLIKNFRRDNPDPDCEHYGIIDKRNAEFSVYHNNGKQVYSVEVLVGAEKSDQRTRWTEYSENVRTPSSSTGAGIFTIRPQNLSDSYNRRNFNNNILSFNDEKNQDTVFAIHQVPVGMSSRYTRFGTNDPEDRRISGGCANLKLEDFLKVKKWLSPKCKVYILPEEEGNKFAVRDNDLRLISTKPVPMNRSNLYNYSVPDSEPKEIDIKIVNSEVNNQETREFIKALEDEKSNLMEIYKLTNDEYNDLAMLAFGILGNESDFGRSKRLKVKENAQFAVIAAKLLKTKDLDVAKNTSRGLTQIKFLPEGPFTDHYPEITKENLMNPRNSAIATMAYLAEASKQMRVIALRNNSDPARLKITRENMMDFMGYLYQGRRSSLTTADPSKQATPEFNGYYRALQRHMSYIEISQRIE